MTQGTYVHTPYSPQVARLRSWRTALIFLLLMALVVGGGIWVLRTYGKRLKAKPVEPTAQHTNLKQSWAYEPERAAQKGVATPPEKDAEVLRQMALGLTNKEIAQTLGISYETVKEHVQHILRKIGVSDRTQAAVWAVRRGLV